MNLIKKYLKEEGRTQKWLAKKVGKSETSVYKYTAGAIPIPFEVAKRMAVLLNTTVPDMFPGKYEYCEHCGRGFIGEGVSR